MWMQPGSSGEPDGAHHKADSPDWSSHQQTLRGGLWSEHNASSRDSPEREPLTAGGGLPSHGQTDDATLADAMRPFSSHSEWSGEEFRTASRENSIPMSHPTPDLQALQGAYVGNIERLEQHAERLSLSSDVGEELRKLRQEQKRSESRRSSLLKSPPLSLGSRAGNSLASPTQGTHADYDSPLASPQTHHNYADSPKDANAREEDSKPPLLSMRSSTSGKYNILSRGSILEPHQEEQARPPSAEFSQLYDAATADLARHPSTASKNTLQQAEAAFAEFDGTQVHAMEPSPEPVETKEIFKSSLHPRSSNQTRTSDTPPPGMVFYPAPIPAVINLPPKLSNRPPPRHIAQRASNILQGGSSNHDSSAPRPPSSAAWNTPGAEADWGSKGAPLPPQLRASAYFDQPTQSGALQLQNGSATATLDMLLDASVHAPVSAFTDHLMVGKLGDEVYGAARDPRRNTSSESKPHSGVPADQDPSGTSSYHENQGTENESADPQPEDDLTARPATLLAELQRRKKQQNSRSKTAANAFPHGMHATLLEMDAVAEVQKQSRKHRTVALAWEEQPEDQVGADEEDEDVPLGLLHARSKAILEDDQPLGILARRQAEDNEPLSKRRARLRGEPVSLAKDDRPNRKSAAQASASDDEGEETLAQRKRRLRIEQAIPKQKTVSVDFASEMLGKLGVPPPPPPVNDEDETLALRKERLKREKAQEGTTKSSKMGSASGQPPKVQPAANDLRTAMVDRWRQSIN